MEHSNPLLKGKSSQKFITVGEIMLRLTPPNYGKIRVSNSFEASYGGSEANIALALANLGIDSTFFSVVPNNSLGKSAVRALRSNDVHCTPMVLSTPEETPTHRLGSYYLETGYGIRASKVTYDRKHSAITEYDFDHIDLNALPQRHHARPVPQLCQAHSGLPQGGPGKGHDHQLRRQLPLRAVELGGGPGFLHPVPALCGCAAGH